MNRETERRRTVDHGPAFIDGIVYRGGYDPLALLAALAP
jgi:hypothetical protein